MKFSIKILPDDICTEANKGTVLSSILTKAGLDVWYPCGRQGSCGKCKVTFLSGAPAAGEADHKALTDTEIEQGVRLACKSRIKSDCVVEVPEAARQDGMISLTESVNREQKLNPGISQFTLHVTKPSLEKPVSDCQLVSEALLKETGKRNFHFSAECLKKLPRALREQNFLVTATVWDGQVVDTEPGVAAGQNLGIALDLGTTTVVASLIDLHNGKTLAVEAMLNPQSQGGDDLISRIFYITSADNALQQLQDLAVRAVNRLIRKLTRKTDHRSSHIYQLVVSGNTVMNHIFLGVDPRNIGVIPFAPVFRNTVTGQADRLGVNMFVNGQVLTMPNIGGFIGGDIVADMLVAGFGCETNSTRLLIDIGTNCEVVLEHNGRRLAASSPAGPALEGSRISQGMRAQPGAISDLFIGSNGIIKITTISNKPPKGLCGSGLFHSIEALLRNGFIDMSGRIPDKPELKGTVPGELAGIVEYDSDGLPRIKLTAQMEKAEADVYLSQKDIREFQLAKAAISSAWSMLCLQLIVDPQEIGQVFIAGAFGNFIRPETLLYLGIVPRTMSGEIHFIGNAALEGARMVLCNHENLGRAEMLAASTEFIELASQTDFQQVYVENLMLGTFL